MKVKEARKAYRQYHATHNQIDYDRYKTLRKEKSKAIKKAIKDYEKTIAKSAKSNAKHYWSYYNSDTKYREKKFLRLLIQMV